MLVLQFKCSSAEEKLEQMGVIYESIVGSPAYADKEISVHGVDDIRFNVYVGVSGGNDKVLTLNSDSNEFQF